MAVASSGVHLLDTSIRRGEPGPLPPPQLPMTPGREVAGVVDELGPDVDAAWLGTPRRGPPRSGQRRLRVAGRRAGDRAAPGARRARHRRRGGADRHRPHGGGRARARGGGTGRRRRGHGGRRRVGHPVRPGRAAPRRHGRRARRRRRQGGAASRRSAPTSPSTTACRTGTPTCAASSTAEPTLVLDGVGGELGRGAFDLLGPGGRIVLFGGPRAPSRRSRPPTSPPQPQRVVVDRPGDDEALGEPRAARATGARRCRRGCVVARRHPLPVGRCRRRPPRPGGSGDGRQDGARRRVASGRWTRWPMSLPRSSRWPTASCGAPSPRPEPMDTRTPVCCTRSGSGTARRSRGGSPPRRARRRRATSPDVPVVALTYWAPTHDTCTAECDAVFEDGPAERQAGWDRFANGPAPVGYDPAIIPMWPTRRPRRSASCASRHTCCG